MFGLGEGGSADQVAVNVPGRSTGAWVAGFAGGRGLEMEGDGEVGEGGDGVIDWVGEEFCAGWDIGLRIAGEGQRAIAGGIDG